MTEMSRQLEWYYKNKERAKKRSASWRKNNPEKQSEINRRYREAFKKKHGMPPSRYYELKRSGALKE